MGYEQDVTLFNCQMIAGDQKAGTFYPEGANSF